jgi:hypothetical protein
MISPHKRFNVSKETFSRVQRPEKSWTIFSEIYNSRNSRPLITKALHFFLMPGNKRRSVMYQWRSVIHKVCLLRTLGPNSCNAYCSLLIKLRLKSHVSVVKCRLGRRICNELWLSAVYCRNFNGVSVSYILGLIFRKVWIYVYLNAEYERFKENMVSLKHLTKPCSLAIGLQHRFTHVYNKGL